MPESGDVILTRVKFADGSGSKIRPALVLFEEFGNVVIAGITTNLRMKGIYLSTSEGVPQDSVIKLNYIFTITNDAILKTVFHLSKEKRQLVLKGLREKLDTLDL
ncbi:toxin component PemK [Ferroplasma acidiphilum]|jgi:mRNA interferase MazF|uniref:Toxin component PemK n=1 Tax=Ferroplasma acidiphilum TaxID=74969 RepID=A0A1V0N3W9_9ARCH|nr:type II toxin-antitoxin system PemK/MazF family toxin [Ferroplasma acidiphilum]ARD84838.1 toxin component PemK [Ferroplasma acidiphilum]